MIVLSMKIRSLQERHHLVCAAIIGFLIFFSWSIPSVVTLSLMLFVSWWAILALGSEHRLAIMLSGGSLLGAFCILLHSGHRIFSNEEITPLQCLEIALQVCVMVTMVFSSIVWIRHILHSKKSGIGEVLGAVNLYAWIAIIYACLYTILSRVDPAAFHLDDQLARVHGGIAVKHTFVDLFYFSFVTQTTLGYGDIVPLSHMARSLVISQAIIGQFYVAVVLTFILNLWIRDLGRQMDQRLQVEETELEQLEKSLKTGQGGDGQGQENR